MRQRKLLLPPFGGARVEAARETIREVAAREFASWGVGERVVVRERMRRLTFEVICRVVFGVTERARVERCGERLVAVIDGSPVFMVVGAARKDLGPGSPGRTFKRGGWRAADEALEAEIEAASGKSGTSRSARRALAAVRAWDEEGRGMTDEGAARRAVHDAGGGARDDRDGAGVRVRAAAAKPAGARGGGGGAGDGEGDEYLDAVAKETLRLRPVIDGAERTLTAPRTLAGWELPAGTKVYPGIALVHTREDL